MDIEPLPCPFCGEQPIILERDVECRKGMTVECRGIECATGPWLRCKLHVREQDQCGDECRTRIVMRWNSRA